MPLPRSSASISRPWASPSRSVRRMTSPPRDPIVAGLLLTVASIVLFDLALLSCLRALDVPWSLAVPLSVLCHAAVSFQLLSLQVKGDFLAAALNLWGIYFGLRYARNRSPLVLGCCAVALLGAFLTKFTALCGAVAVCIWLVRRGERRQAVTLAALQIGRAHARTPATF